MDDEQTMEKDIDELPWETMEEEDVIEAPARKVWLGSQHQLRMGTASDGLIFGHLVWPKGHYTLRVETKDLSQQFPGRETPEISVQTGRMCRAKLQEAKLDCLLIDGLQANWLTWLSETSDNDNPKVIVWMVPEDCQGNDTSGPTCSSWRKKMKHCSYTGRCWHLCASQCGAALDQARLAVVYFQADDVCDDGPTQPEQLGGST
jgi:hypothetical protein